MYISKVLKENQRYFINQRKKGIKRKSSDFQPRKSKGELKEKIGLILCYPETLV